VDVVEDQDVKAFVVVSVTNSLNAAGSGEEYGLIEGGSGGDGVDEVKVCAMTGRSKRENKNIIVAVEVKDVDLCVCIDWNTSSNTSLSMNYDF